MGYDGTLMEDKQIDKLRTLLKKSKKFVVVNSLSQPEIRTDKTMVKIDGNKVITHDLDTAKLEKFLIKNKIIY